MSGTTPAWPVAGAIHDLIDHFPLPLALLDGAGGVLFMNDRFDRTYGAAALDRPPLRDIARQPASGWKKIRVADRRRGLVDVNAQVMRFEDHPLLILDDIAGAAAAPEPTPELTQLQARIAELEALSATDALTGAWNRAHFDRAVTAEVERSLRFKQPVSLIFTDIDHFKAINDTHGHPAGDRVLRELTRLIGTSIRSIDLLFRWGGEEFVVLASATGYRFTADLAERIRSAVERHRFAGVAPVTISLGVAEHLAGESVESWFGRADQALYRAKNDGRNRVCTDRCGSSDLWAAETGLAALHLVWQEGFECGEPAIDSEHRGLFERANAVIDAAFNAGTVPDILSAALDELLEQLARHCAHEEELLAQRGYEDLAAHCAAHAALLARAAEMKASVAAGRARSGDLVEFIARTVVAGHLFKEDRKYFPLFRQGA